ncbi:MAG: ammonium transporter, partial [Pseudomonadota bacterium]|nr:ammonium transporter [Pseudomonadota bacterium]
MKRIAVVALILGVNWANADELNTGDTAWILTSTALVLFMTIPGLSLFYGGLVRSRNVLSVLMQCFSITCVVTILWLLIGYSLAFDVGNSFIGGLSKGLFAGVDEGAVVGTIPESSFAIFQLTFAIITPALIVGGFAERMRFVSVLAFTALWSIIVYAPITHWVWAEGGWLFERGFLDFAGGSVVHMTAGTAAVVTALVLKARQGFPTQPMPPHNMTLTMAGAGMLWVGWFGFNGGSALTAGGNAAMAIAVTHISAAAGAFTWMSVEWIKYGKPSALGAVTGMVAGL